MEEQEFVYFRDQYMSNAWNILEFQKTKVTTVYDSQGPFLLTWINLNPSMNK